MTLRLHGCAIRFGPARLPAGPVVTDRNVAPLVRARGPVLVLPPGERTKTLRTAERVHRWLASNRVERGDTIVAVGGGVIGDLVGFVAATYRRGVGVVLVPTTLLAQVDAAIGGKTAVNLPEGKNLVGTYTQPREVLVDPRFLRTLPPRAIRSGMAEIIKSAMIGDRGLFELLQRRASLSKLIPRAVRVKVDVVRADERETGRRAVLNYGHTIGHAIEAASGYRLTHGEAVAIGMNAEARLARAIAGPQAEILQAYGLPLRARGLSRRAVMEHLWQDKKVRGGRLRFALPTRIGAVRFPVVPPRRAVEEAIDHVLD